VNVSKSSDPERLNNICVAGVSDQDFISPVIDNITRIYKYLFMKNDKFQENLSRPGMIDTAARRLRNTILRHPPTTFPLQSVLTQAVYRQATRNSHRE